MHRSGTSTVGRAVNLLGVYLGKPEHLGTANEDNPEGYWERPDITGLNERLLHVFGRRWDSVAALPGGWNQSEEIVPFRKDIRNLISTQFGDQPLWGWKDPRTCLVLPLWREVLQELHIELCGIVVLRNPLDVANSLKRRDGMRLGQALGLWFNYTLAALEGSRSLPLTFLSYDRLLEAWEPELRRCAQSANIPWPADQASLEREMNSFIRPRLRHSQSTVNDLQLCPHPVRELYTALMGVLDSGSTKTLLDSVDRLSLEFNAYASFFERGLDNAAIVQAPRPHYLQRTFWRWKRSIRKRLSKRKLEPGDLNPVSSYESK